MPKFQPLPNEDKKENLEKEKTQNESKTDTLHEDELQNNMPEDFLENEEKEADTETEQKKDKKKTPDSSTDPFFNGYLKMQDKAEKLFDKLESNNKTINKVIVGKVTEKVKVVADKVDSVTGYRAKVAEMSQAKDEALDSIDKKLGLSEKKASVAGAISDAATTVGTAILSILTPQPDPVSMQKKNDELRKTVSEKENKIDSAEKQKETKQVVDEIKSEDNNTKVGPNG